MARVFVYSDKPQVIAELVSSVKNFGKTAAVITVTDTSLEALKKVGADQIYVLHGDSELVENYSKAMADLLKKEQAAAFLVGATPRGRDIAARVAGYLDCEMASDVSSLTFTDGGLQTERFLYGGTAVQHRHTEELCVITVPVGMFDSSIDQKTEPEVISLEVVADTRVACVSTAPIVRQGVDLAAAEKIVSIGMGMREQADMQIAKELADVLGAEIGCSRNVAEERKWLPTEQYIGMTGTIVKPKLYIAMGISGQVQHVFGVRDAQTIVAINTDADAHIFKAADYGIVGDMYEVVPMLTEALKKL